MKDQLYEFMKKLNIPYAEELVKIQQEKKKCLSEYLRKVKGPKVEDPFYYKESVHYEELQRCLMIKKAQEEYYLNKIFKYLKEV